jgi:hypothetical protein
VGLAAATAAAFLFALYPNSYAVVSLCRISFAQAPLDFQVNLI